VATALRQTRNKFAKSKTVTLGLPTDGVQKIFWVLLSKGIRYLGLEDDDADSRKSLICKITQLVKLEMLIGLAVNFHYEKEMAPF
jgi:hypothetical protein